MGGGTRSPPPIQLYNFMLKLVKEFKNDEAFIESKKDKNIKSIQNDQMSYGRKLINSVDNKDLTSFLIRQQISLRMTKWILNKAILASFEHGGIGRYLEKLVIKDLHLKHIEKEIGTQFNEKEIRGKRRK